MLSIRNPDHFFARVREFADKGQTFASMSDRLGRGFAGRPISPVDFEAFLVSSVNDGTAPETFCAWWHARSPIVPAAAAAPSAPTAADNDKAMDARVETRVQDATRQIRAALNLEKSRRTEAQASVQSLTERVDRLESELATARARGASVAKSIEEMTMELGSVRGLLGRRDIRVRELEEELRLAGEAKAGLEARLRRADGMTSVDAGATWADAVRASEEAALRPRASAPRRQPEPAGGDPAEVRRALAVLVRTGTLSIEEAIERGAATR